MAKDSKDLHTNPDSTKLNPCSPDAPTVCGREAAKKKKHKGFAILITFHKKDKK